MTEIEELLAKKKEIGDERDLCAEVYNVWITRLHEVQNDPKKYKMYLDMIQVMEPYGQILKEEIREINRRLCEIEGVDSIDQTKHFRECNNKYNKDRPNPDRIISAD
jgi:hypothetical protein